MSFVDRHSLLYLVLGIWVWGCSSLAWGEWSGPRGVRSKVTLKKDKAKKKRTLWRRFAEGIARWIPKPVKEGWRRTAKKWNQMVAVYRAVRDLVQGDKEARRKAAKVRQRKAIRKSWVDADRRAEQRALRGLRLVLWQRSCRAGSERACRRWARRAPKALEPLLFLRDILRQRENWKPLLRVCRVLQRRKPGALENRLCMADALLALGQKKKALNLYRGMSMQFPESGVVWLEWGHLWLQEEKWSRAQSTCARAVRRMPRDPAAWRCLGDAWAQNKSERWRARAAYEKACSLGDNKACKGILRVLPQSGWRRWWIWSRIRSKLMGRFTVRGSCNFGVGAACRSMARMYRRRAQTLQRYQRYSEALWWFRRAALYAPQDAGIWRSLGLLLMEHRLSSSACRALRRSLRLQPKQWGLWLKLGLCYQVTAQKDLKQARDAYLRACQPKRPGVGKPEACRKACALGAKAACYHRMSGPK